jgi:hypothetical protein
LLCDDLRGFLAFEGEDLMSESGFEMAGCCGSDVAADDPDSTFGVFPSLAFSRTFVREVFRLALVEDFDLEFHGLGNFPGQSSGIPLLEVTVPFVCRSSVLSMTSLPKDTVFRRVVPVPGVRRIPGGFVGDRLLDMPFTVS